MCIQLILTTATILPINVVDTASVSDLVLTTNLGIQFECYYIGKDKPTEIPITLFHPNESCLKSQTTVLKRGSSIFFSGALTSTEETTRSAIHKKIKQQSAPVLGKHEITTKIFSQLN
ncbi:21751_t:CDS:2 [Rhizophagus irregularis]|nr:21751_t:CDS:2 [Rhizophagus irregularis]